MSSSSHPVRRYTDLTGEFTAALYGHSHPVILSAINDAMRNVGMNIGGTTAQEGIFAREMCKRFGLERVRFANSGTEANLHALQAAKVFTGKRKVVAFGGGYHGGVLGFAGGVPGKNTVDREEWIVARYNDLDDAKTAIRSEGCGCYSRRNAGLRRVHLRISRILERRPRGGKGGKRPLRGERRSLKEKENMLISEHRLAFSSSWTRS